MAKKEWSVWVNLLANTRQFSKEMDSSIARLNKLGLSADKVTRRVRNMGLVAVGGVTAMTASVVSAASAAENYRIRLEAVLGSTGEANRLFRDQANFAANVAYEYRDIMGSATALAGVMRGGVDEVNKWMPMITDLATVTGLSVEETTGQVIRMYSAGAASADLFRERGVLAMLGFQAGVSYSADETRRMLIEAFEDPQSKFRDASKNMANTWTGLMSMLSDRWFQFRTMVADAGMFDAAKNAASRFLEYLKTQAESGALQVFAGSISDMIMGAVRGFGTLLVKLGETINYVSNSPLIGKLGLMGYILFGKFGALAFGAGGGIIEGAMRRGVANALGAIDVEKDIERITKDMEGFWRKGVAPPHSLLDELGAAQLKLMQIHDIVDEAARGGNLLGDSFIAAGDAMRTFVQQAGGEGGAASVVQRLMAPPDPGKPSAMDMFLEGFESAAEDVPHEIRIIEGAVERFGRFFEDTALRIADNALSVGLSFKNMADMVIDSLKRIAASNWLRRGIQALALASGGGGIVGTIAGVLGFEAAGGSAASVSVPAPAPAGRGGGGMTIQNLTYAPMVSTRGDAAMLVDQLKRLGVNVRMGAA